MRQFTMNWNVSANRLDRQTNHRLDPFTLIPVYQERYQSLAKLIRFDLETKG